MTVYRLTSDRRISRSLSIAGLFVVLGLIIAVATPASAQMPPEQLPSVSEKTKDATLGTGEDPVANPLSTASRDDSSKDTPEANAWAPVPTKNASLANLAAALLPYFNNGPVFGLPGTDVTDFWHRTQLSGDWGGTRTDLAHHGVFIDLYLTSAFQDVASGGLKTGGAFIQNTQLSINIDTGRAGLWSGGLFHVTLESRYGSSSPQNTFDVGSTVPQYTGLAFPGPFFVHDVLPTEYFLLQSLTPQVSVLVGRINVLTMCDQTLFGNSYQYDFANLNFNKNPMALNFYNTTSLAAGGVWTPSQKLVVFGGVFDPNSKADNIATKAFDRVNLYGTAIFSYKIGGLPGQSWAQFNWTDKPKIDLRTPFGQLPPGTNSQAIGALLGGPSVQGLPINYSSDSWVTIGNVSQYVFVKDHSEAVAHKLGSGQPLRGVGVFGRVGYAPQQTNTITRDGSMALFANGLLNSRKNDSFGAGVYYNGISSALKLDINQLMGSRSGIQDEKGLEVFYDFAITPALRIIPSYQHIWNPLTADVAAHQRRADVLLVRFAVIL